MCVLKPIKNTHNLEGLPLETKERRLQSVKSPKLSTNRQTLLFMNNTWNVLFTLVYHVYIHFNTLFECTVTLRYTSIDMCVYSVYSFRTSALCKIFRLYCESWYSAKTIRTIHCSVSYISKHQYSPTHLL